MSQAGIEITVGDLRDADSQVEATKGADTVYHIAAVYQTELADKSLFRDINADGTAGLLYASIRNGVRRFVHCSTVGVHGEIKDPPADETAPIEPGDVYQESKLECENIARRYLEDGKIPLTIFRPVGISGPGDLRFLKLFSTIAK